MLTALGCITLLSILLWAKARRKLAEVARERQRLHHLASATFEALVIERDGVVLDANGRMGELVGYDPASLIGQAFERLVPPEDMSGRTSRASDRILRHQDGRVVPVELLSRTIDYNGQPANAIAVRDLSRRRRGDAVYALSQFDALTGLASRVLLDGRLARALAAAGADGPVAVLRLNLDRFGAVNDRLGQAGGDKLLVAVGERLSGLVRNTDTLARLSADEFVVLLPAPDGVPSIAVSLASRITSSLAKPFGIDGQEVTVGVSAGIAIHPEDGNTAEKLLRSADIAMQSAKAGGRGVFRLFHPQMDQTLAARQPPAREQQEAATSEERVHG